MRCVRSSELPVLGTCNRCGVLCDGGMAMNSGMLDELLARIDLIVPLCRMRRRLLSHLHGC